MKNLVTKKINVIIQARISSLRLPGKVLKKIQGKPMLYYVINQVKHAKYTDKIIIATTTKKEDEKIVDYCKNSKINFFRGSKLDLLDRYYQCAKKFGCDPVVRITSDCPLIDPNVIDQVIEKFIQNSFDYVSNNIEKIGLKWNNHTCNFPPGMTVEVSSFKALEKAWKKAKKPSEREHVYPYIQFNPKIFKISNVKHNTDLSHIRCTVDRIEDLKFVRTIINKIPAKKKFVTISDILKIVALEPKLIEINNKTSFDEGWQISVLKDKELGF